MGNLLEISPARIQNFYEKLSTAIRGPSGGREVHFLSSRTALVVLANKSNSPAIDTLRADLEAFERQEKIDLYLYLDGVIKPMSPDLLEQRPPEAA